jgi:hypothetical protein
MIRFLIVRRIKGLLLGLKKPLSIILTLAFVLTAWLYGWLLASLINESSKGEIGNISPEKIINYSLCLIMGLVLLRMILPRYTPQKQLLPKFYPITTFQNYLISVISDFLNPLFFSIAFFIIICSWYLHEFKLLFLLLGFSALASAQLLRRLIQYGIDFRIKNKGYLLLIISLLLIYFLSYYYAYLNQHLKALSLFIPIYLFCIGYLMELTIIESRINEISGGSGKSNLYLKLITNNPKARLTLLVGVLIKFFLLTVDFIWYKKNGTHIFDGQLVYWMFASPLILFTYVFNNVWGYWPSVWLIYEIRIGGNREIIHFVIKLLTIPLIIDLLITIPLLLLTWDNYIFIIIIYLLSSLFLVSFCSIWSIIFPKKIISTFQMSGTSSFVGSLVSMIAVISLSVLKLNYWFYVLIPIYLTASFIAYKYSPDLYKERKYSLLNKLFNE